MHRVLEEGMGQYRGERLPPCIRQHILRPCELVSFACDAQTAPPGVGNSVEVLVEDSIPKNAETNKIGFC